MHDRRQPPRCRLRSHRRGEPKLSSEAAVLFDFDGVVAELDRRVLLAASAAQVRHFRIPIERVLSDYFYRHPQNPALDLGLITIEEVREAIRREIWRGPQDEWVAWWRLVERSYVVRPQMHRWLTALRRRYRLGLVSDNHLGFRAWLRALGADRYFATVVCSAEVGVKKPSLALFDVALRALHASSDTAVYIDDDASNVSALCRAGLAAIHFRSVAQARPALGALLDARAAGRVRVPSS